jgi:peptide/nickel transport system permease protein
LQNRPRPGTVQADVLAYVVRRVLWVGVLFLAITAVTYILFFILPVQKQQRVRRTEFSATDVRHELNINGPVYVEYAKFLSRTLHGDLGHSFVDRQKVTTIVKDAAPITAWLVLGGAFFWLLIAIPVGILSALRPRSLLDRITMTGVLIGISAHPLWIGLMLSYFLGYRLHAVPLGGYCDLVNPSTACGGPVQWAYHMMLPWLTFTILFAALYVRMIRANVLDVLDSDYVQTARAKGASPWRVLRSHVVRNALLPVVTMLGMDMGVAFGGAVFVESVYGLPGLGQIAVASLRRQDLPTIMGIIVWSTLAILTFNLIVDLVYAALDPRVKLVEPKDRAAAAPAPTAAPSTTQPATQSAR